MQEFPKFAVATIVVVVLAGIIENFWSGASFWFILLVLLSVAITYGNFGSELSAIAKLIRGR